MQSSVNKVLIGAVVFAVSCVIAVVGYRLAGWTTLDAVYMVTITIFGVGYGEVRPIDDPALRLFTIGVIISGCTSSIYVIGGFIQMMTEGELNRFLGARKMTRGMEKLSNHVIVCGFGRVGRILAEELTESGESFVVIDTNSERLQRAEAAGTFVLVGDATEESVLEVAGIGRARVLAVVLPNDAANVFITLTARGFSEDIEIIARAQSPSTERKLYRAGATRVVLPAALGATQIAGMITRPSAEQLFHNNTQQKQLAQDLEAIGLRLTELPIPDGSPFVGRALGEMSLGDAYQFVVIGIRAADGSLTRDPEHTCRLSAGDTIILLVHKSAEVKLRKAASPVDMIYRGVRAT